MTQPETSQPVVESDSSSATSAAEAPAPESAPEPPPEPMTPQRVTEWNAYYDAYVVGAALLLAFVVSCNYLSDSGVWLHLKTGQLIGEQMAPVTTDLFSYTQTGKPWLDLPWLFQWSHAALYKLIHGLVPTSTSDTAASGSGPEQIAIGTLGVVSALARLLTAWALLKIRHRGPGLWWSAVCVVLALGAVYQPVFGVLDPWNGIRMGGVAGPASIAPATWGQLLLAVELLLLFRAYCLGWGRSLWLLVPLFFLWANVDESFLTGLFVLAASAIGYLLDGGAATPFFADGESSGEPGSGAKSVSRHPRPAEARLGLVILGLCAAACLINPLFYRAYLVALAPYLNLFQPAGTITTIENLSFFGPGIRQPGNTYWYLFPAYFLVVVAVGLSSFLLNVRRFTWARFLPFLLAAVIWGTFMRWSAFFGLVLAYVLALNGQEWYLDRFGTEGRLGTRWALWSTGGRAVTLLLIFCLVGKNITGWKNAIADPQFGLGFHTDEFPFEAAQFLDSHPAITGNILNTSFGQGDVLIWKSGPQRKTFVDGRSRLFPQEVLDEWNKIRNAIKVDNKETWQPLLNKHNISAVMIEPAGAPITLNTLMQSANWIPFYHDGCIVMFGRKDAPASDVAVFEANRLDADHRAYFTNHPVPSFERPPQPTGILDLIFQGRTSSRPQCRSLAALYWLVGGSSQDSSATSEPLPEPSRCLLAIQEARVALSRSPDDWTAYRVLKDAYRHLMVQEAAMLAGIPITPENRERMRSVQPALELVRQRFRQRVTALNYAVLTTPPPQSPDARRLLESLNLELFQLYLAANARDLARERLQAALQDSQPDDFVPERRAELQRALTQLDQQVKQIEERVADLEIERQAGPVDQATYAMSLGGAAWAINKFADAERNSVSLAVVKPQLIDLYCDTGQPDKALDLLAVGAIDDPNLGAQPGMPALRQGTVYFLLGNYLTASALWMDKAIPRLRLDRSNRAVLGGSGLARGDAVHATNTFLSLPGTLSQQAQWEYDLAMCQLEAGEPLKAASHFTEALTHAPDLAVRPIAAYYLTKMGRPVPPPSKRPAAAAKAPASPATAAPSGTGRK